MATSDRTSLEKQLSRARRVLQLLQEQRSAYGMRVPVDLQLELEEQAERVEQLEDDLKKLGQPDSPITPLPDRQEPQAKREGEEAEPFDVFLCHNTKDKDAVIAIARQLQDRGLKPWLDIWELRPGFPWQRILEKEIGVIKSAAVFIGSSGLGPWQTLEIEGFLRQFVTRECPVIPVMLEAAPERPELPAFLGGMGWVDFRESFPDPLEQLIWGITGKNPN